MQAWFLRGEQGSEAENLGAMLRQWSGRPENSRWSVEGLAWTTDVLSMVKARPPEVLLWADGLCPPAEWIGEVLALGVGAVVATSLERVELYRSLAEQYAVELLHWPASIESLGLAIFNVLAHRDRQRQWQTRIEQLQQRLSDRIVIERAKGILVQQLGISEQEAYSRLRVLSRRQRRQVRDIAQSLLDTQSLLLPESNGFAESDNQGEQAPASCSEAPG